MRFGVRLPTFAWPDLSYDQAAQVKEFARKAEDLGFDAIWAVEHFQVAPGLYGTVWMSPLLCLAHAASVTSRIRLATGILVLPYYHPVTLARQIQTLQYLSGGRFVLGAAPGWDEHEFDALGMQLRERGGRTDEILAALRRLLTERNVSFAGRYYKFRDVTIEPLLSAFPELWVAGGGKQKTALSPDKTEIAPAVLRRIASADAWMGRGAGTQEMLKNDLQTIRAYLTAQGRDPSTLHYGHGNWTHLVDTTDREEALRLQRPMYERAMGPHRTFEQLQRSYFMGTASDVVERIKDLERAGFDYIVFGPLDYLPEQLERIASDVMPHFR